MANLKITLERGVIGTKPSQRATVAALGLKKREHFVIKEDTPQLRGMINKVKHLVKVEEQ
ncbi:50S ribosomal protein L30 [Criibacterium bergeronii]|uniref:Large ribosomal subunit protein uL30 n=1 Tax=Criibacterium bergeronii TaxID=1871336 RepID=A0A371IMU5_9FIRM|nr:50S ribosomal protein L30 [Criibacterium bergeronii]MBS6063896.1 50S ribosomal protein L30 [Peptostreptococcaceae bacterium]RDY21770.1 50S ribosomal protein L30 [Criibacterium bergeronii]TRW26013.1 50S ribosomal protein L30 [Criibacterium bergeronii]